MLFLGYGCFGLTSYHLLRSMKQSLKYILFILLFAFLGFSREFLFVNINNQLYKLFYNAIDVRLPESLVFLESWDYTTLYYAKYPLTIAYFLAYFFTTLWAVKLICDDKKYSRWVVYIYALLLLLAGLTMGYNYAINDQLNGEGYTFSRWLMGIAQSPLVAFFIIAAGKLYKKIQQDN